MEGVPASTRPHVPSRAPLLLLRRAGQHIRRPGRWSPGAPSRVKDTKTSGPCRTNLSLLQNAEFAGTSPPITITQVNGWVAFYIQGCTPLFLYFLTPSKVITLCMVSKMCRGLQRSEPRNTKPHGEILWEKAQGMGFCGHLALGFDIEARTVALLDPQRSLCYSEAADFYYVFKGSKAPLKLSPGVRASLSFPLMLIWLIKIH